MIDIEQKPTLTTKEQFNSYKIRSFEKNKEMDDKIIDLDNKLNKIFIELQDEDIIKEDTTDEHKLQTEEILKMKKKIENIKKKK